MARVLLSRSGVEPSSVILMKFTALTCGVAFFMSGSLGLVFEPLESCFRIFKLWVGWDPPPDLDRPFPRRKDQPLPRDSTLKPRKTPRRLPAGVEILRIEHRHAGAVCGVCASALEGERVYCQDCHAPHHPVCFAYNTRCATYACGCTETT